MPDHRPISEAELAEEAALHHLAYEWLDSPEGREAAILDWIDVGHYRAVAFAGRLRIAFQAGARKKNAEVRRLRAALRDIGGNAEEAWSAGRAREALEGK